MLLHSRLRAKRNTTARLPLACTDMATLYVTDCDANDSKGCAAGLTCGKDNCDKFHPNLAAAGMSGSSDCCEEQVEGKACSTDDDCPQNGIYCSSQVCVCVCVCWHIVSMDIVGIRLGNRCNNGMTL